MPIDMNDQALRQPPYQDRSHLAGYLLGFALGGFFDGILLHQILQWHHLLSGIARAPFTDLRVQILADGLFHALMYVIAAVGLWKLLRASEGRGDRPASRQLLADMLIGFGAWHVVDSVVSHWLLGIHRIRMDTPNPLLWDLIWFAVFGLLALLAGIAMRRHGSSPDKDRQRTSRSTPLSLLIIGVAAAAIWSALPPSGQRGMVTVLLRPDANPAQLLAGLQHVDGRVLWSSNKGEVWVFALSEPSRASTLYAHGALLVSSTLLPAGCSAWLKK